MLYFSYVLQRGTVAVDCLPTYEILQENTGISDPVAYFNGLSLEQMERLPPERRFFQNTYAPIGGRMYIKKGGLITLPKKDKNGVNLYLPDVVLYDEKTNVILLVEGKMLSRSLSFR